MKIRQGDERDIPAILGLLDRAVEWLVSQGRDGQWGTQPWSARPEAVARVGEIVRDGTPWLAEVGGETAGAMTLTPHPTPYVPAAAEPEVYVHLLVTDRRHAGHGIGGALLKHAVAEARRQGIGLLRVDCYAGGDGRLVEFYRGQGFEPVERFTVGDWPGQLLAQRVA